VNEVEEDNGLNDGEEHDPMISNNNGVMDLVLGF